MISVTNNSVALVMITAEVELGVIMFIHDSIFKTYFQPSFLFSSRNGS